MLVNLKEYTPKIMGLDELKKYAVCIPLIKTEDSYDILFEIRSEKIGHQPGDVCLPGGKVEAEESPCDAAVREAMEELLIERSNIEVLGASDLYIATGNLLIYPYIVELLDYNGSYSKEEVGDVFRVPISYFLNNDPETYYTKTVIEPEENFPFDRIRAGKDYKWRKQKNSVYFYEYEGHVIWGMTAKIMRSFSNIYKEAVLSE